ncbi:MAG: hypothetical protein MI923_20765 [Phycisphaerales bacterium]|nr:hypothetical protein [Phycisphaerales bacterium]
MLDRAIGRVRPRRSHRQMRNSRESEFHRPINFFREPPRTDRPPNDASSGELKTSFLGLENVLQMGSRNGPEFIPNGTANNKHLVHNVDIETLNRRERSAPIQPSGIAP